MKQYRNLIKYPDFMRVFLAGVVNTFGDCFDQLATSWLVLELTGSGYWFALNFAVNALPNLVIQPFLGVFIERVSKKWVMIVADIGRALLVVVLIGLYINNMLPPTLVLVFSFLMTCFEALRQPAAMSLSPHLVDEDMYAHSTSLKTTVITLATLAGTALAGIVIATQGIAFALWIDVISFVISAVILSTLKKDIKNQKGANPSTYSEELKEGWNYFIKNGLFFKLAIVGFFINMVMSGFNILMMPFAVEVLNQDASYISLFQSLMMASMLVSSAVFPYIFSKLSSAKIFLLGGILFAVGILSYASLAYASNLYLITAIAAFCFGIGSGVVPATLSVTLMKVVAKDKLARVAAFYNSFAYAAAPVGSLVIAALMAVMSQFQILILCGVLLVIIFILFYLDRSFEQV